jgi:hypothetical protein
MNKHSTGQFELFNMANGRFLPTPHFRGQQQQFRSQRQAFATLLLPKVTYFGNSSISMKNDVSSMGNKLSRRRCHLLCDHCSLSSSLSRALSAFVLLPSEAGPGGVRETTRMQQYVVDRGCKMNMDTNIDISVPEPPVNFSRSDWPMFRGCCWWMPK